jgi:site-specific recombinase XerD
MGDPRTFLEDGLYMKPDKGGRVRWYGRAWVPSLRTRRFWALGTSEARARKQWHAVLADVEAAAARQDAERRQRRGDSLKVLVNTFLGSFRTRSGRTPDYHAGVLKPMLAAFGSLPPAKIDAAVLDRYLEDRRTLATKGVKRKVDGKTVVIGAGQRRISESTLRKELIVLGTVFRWAKRRGLVEANPLAEYEKPKNSSEPPLVALSHDQEDALLSFLPPLERDVVEWAIYTGMRLGEFRWMSWRTHKAACSVVDRAAGVVHVIKTKTGKARNVPLSISERLPAILDRHPQRIDCPWVFHDQDGQPLDKDHINGVLEAAMKAAGIPKTRGVLWNLLRKTTSTRLYEAGALPQDEADILGHSMAVAVRNYRALSADRHERLAGILDPGRGARGGARDAG